jgi:NAD(P)H-dependent FMN reductase
MLKLKIVIASTRPGRAADQVHPWIAAKARQHEAFDVEMMDLREWDLPMFVETFATVGNPADPTFSAPIVKRWNDNVRDGDAYLFITPEYNHSVPAALKNAIDSVFATFGFRNKPMACIAYSGSIAGGVRAVEHLAHIAIEAEMVPLRNNVIIPYVGEAFEEDGFPRDPRTETAADILLDDLAWWGTTLQAARSEGQLPHAYIRQMAGRSSN